MVRERGSVCEERGRRQGDVNKQTRRKEEERNNTGNQGGISWCGAGGGGQRAGGSGRSRERQENQRQRGGMMDRNTDITQEQSSR